MNSLRFLFGAAACLLALPLPAQEARLSNLAIRAQGGGGDTLITGFTVGPGPSKSVLIRAVGPTLGGFGVGGALADPKLELYNGAGTKIAENDNWRELDATAFSAVGAFPLGSGSKDAALLAELAPGSYTAQVSGVGGAAGVALVEVYEVNAGTTRLVNLSTRAFVGTGGNILIPGLTIAPGSGSRKLLIRAVGPTLGAFGVPGTLADPKLELFSGSTKTAENDNWGTPVGTAANAEQLGTAFTSAGAFALTSGSKDAALLISLTPGSYTLQVSGVGNTTGAALVEVYDLTPPPPTTTLFVAQLRPDASATGSTASGYATILVSEDGKSATVNVTFSGLAGAQTAGYLRISGDPVLALGLGQVSGRSWAFNATAQYTTADLIAALQSGRLTVGVDSSKYPTGELRGTFLVSAGSQIFIAPPAPPEVAASILNSPSDADAARLLMQATFGPTPADIAKVKSRGIRGWLDDQFATPATSHLAATRADVAAFPNDRSRYPATTTYLYSERVSRHAAWWKTAINAPDQLRQRVAFALSEVLIVSQADSNLGNETEALAHYYDKLVTGAFGNFRQLLEDVTLHSCMGIYLSHAGNRKADAVAGTFPDENYAREVMQLFTIGLVQLQPDGTLMLDATGQPIPTYDQTTITETAKVLTGWHWFQSPTATSFGPGPVSTYDNGAPDGHPRLVPMKFSAFAHDTTAKRIVSLQQVPLDQATPTLIPAGQAGPDDLKMLLDTLFNHPNTGPFIARHLIKFLVTSNPSPGYVYRVAQAFANDGTGARGNMAAVVRAILTDYEARSPAVINNIGYGKIREPLLRMAALLRLVKASAPNGRYLDSWIGDPRQSALGAFYGAYGFFVFPQGQTNQAPLYAPSVFNFFSPDYVVPGALAAAGLVTPEMEIIDANIALQTPNQMASFLDRSAPPVVEGSPTPSPFLTVDLSDFLPNARNATALVDQLNVLFCAGGMSGSLRTLVLNTLSGLPSAATDSERVRTAIHMVLFSPDSSTQR